MIYARPTALGREIEKVTMAGKMVIEHKCQRCTRVWYDEPKPEGAAPFKLAIKLVGPGATPVDVTWDDLCETCTGVANTLVGQLTKPLRHQAPRRGAKKPGGAVAPPAPTKPAVVPAERIGARASGHSS